MDGFKNKLNYSIQFRLSFWLTVIISLMAAVAIIVSYFSALNEAKEIQDEGLKQVAKLIKREQTSFPLNENIVKSEIFIRPIPSYTDYHPSADHLQLTNNLSEGLHTLKIKQSSYRVLILRLPNQEKIAVAQSTVLRDEAAISGALSTALPMILLLLILIAAAYFLIQNTFQPITLLSDDIQQRDAQDLTPFTVATIPTEVRPLLTAINQLFDKVSQSVASQKRFIADAAHELRTPLTALSLQSERLAGTEMSDIAYERLQTLRQGIDRASVLLEQLLSLAKAQNVIQQDVKVLSVNQLYINVLEDLLPIAEAKGINVGIKSKQDVIVKMSEMDLLSIIKNLVDNAIRYTPNGGQVDLSVIKETKNVILEIEDSGCGIPDAEKERVFDAFYRILGNDSQGSGLGLPIVKTILNRIRGSITLSDSDNFPTGLKIRVNLPLST